MRVLKIGLVLSTVVAISACERQSEAASTDLTWLDSLDIQNAPATAVAPMALSPAELGLLATSHPEAAPAAPAASKVEARAERSTSSKSSRRSTSAARSSRRSSGTYASSGSVQRQPRVVTVKHTKRDAAIGAGAGAVIGAVAGGPRHRVKGAVIGAAVGGVAGAVIGNNVDKSTRVVY